MVRNAQPVIAIHAAEHGGFVIYEKWDRGEFWPMLFAGDAQAVGTWLIDWLDKRTHLVRKNAASEGANDGA